MQSFVVNREREHESFIYAGRRKFLVDAGKDILEPPTLFKTKKQARKLVPSNNTTNGKDDEAARYNFATNRATSMFLNKISPEAAPPKVKAKKPPPVNNTLVIETYSSVSRDDWKERTQAGVRIWINKSTGEVSTECPWLPSARIYKNRKRTNDRNARYQAEEGTGSLVYDNTELKELFDILDHCKLEKSTTTTTTDSAGIAVTSETI